MTTNKDLNWQRAYKVEFGVPEYKEESYIFDELSAQFTNTFLGINLNNNQGAKILVDSQTVPADAISLSNLKEDGNSLRGFTFELDSTRKASSGGNSKGEKTTLKFFNLNKNSVDLLNKDNCVIRVSAGYNQKVSLCYSGDVIEVTPLKQGSDVIHIVRCKDGDVSSKNTAGTIVFDEETSEKDMIIQLATKFPDASLGFLGLDTLSLKYTTGGRSYQGFLDDIFNSVMAKNNLTYTRYNGKINIFPYTIDQASADFKKLAVNTYIINTDTVKAITPVSKNGKKTSLEKKTRSGINLNTTFIPIELGQFFTIKNETSEEYEGTYLVTGIRTVLKSHGNNWDVVLSGEPI